MGVNVDLFNRIDEWAAEGLITAEQAATLRARLATEGESDRAQPVQVTEILVYLGSIVVFLALAFLAILNWQALGSGGRVLILLMPALAMFALGWPLRTSTSAHRQRGAQALWLGASLITGIFFLILFTEFELIDWRERGPTDFTFLLSCLLAGGVSGLAYALLPTVVQSIPFHLWLTVAFISFLGWLEMEFPPFNPWLNLILGLLVGAVWLAFGAWLNRQDRERLAAVSLLVGTITALSTSFSMAAGDVFMPGQTGREAVTLVVSLLFIAASVRFQSRIFLYSGAAFLLILITYFNFRYFADDVGMPVALFLSGVALIVLGLGTGRLNWLMHRRIPTG